MKSTGLNRLQLTVERKGHKSVACVPLHRVAKTLAVADSSCCVHRAQVEQPGRGDALRSLRLLDSEGTSLWWRAQ